ncbi:LysR family transcriptional regulator [Roseococcus pinisoli]|uniref:LysR family transcriptional regulator n=1 Tax=Roseococcus pinisoli TaxID=2835040 RepID=A0ABS5QHG1_9PROT|nr:LysR family transcriptional regulator [Roseococcus pinisoli]MBS7813130.1 LysR family transcriptional regulator [Roseococcus pinisoli]
MNIKQLEAFLAIARHGSFVEAAERLNLTQSTVSARIKELEQDLAVPLFDRTRRQIQLTPKGRELLDYADRALALQQEIKRRIGSPEALAGVVRIGVAELIAVTWLPRFTAMVRERYPAVTLQFEVAMNPSMLNGVRSGDLDIGLIIQPERQTELEMRHLGTVPFAWMAGTSFELPERAVTAEDLRRWPIIYQSADSYMNQLMNSILYPGGGGRRSGTSCNSLAARISLTAAGLGVSLMPLTTLGRDIQEGRLRILPIEPRHVEVSYSAVCAISDSAPGFRLLMDLAVAASSFQGVAEVSTPPAPLASGEAFPGESGGPP